MNRVSRISSALGLSTVLLTSCEQKIPVTQPSKALQRVVNSFYQKGQKTLQENPKLICYDTDYITIGENATQDISIIADELKSKSKISSYRTPKDLVSESYDVWGRTENYIPKYITTSVQAIVDSLPLKYSHRDAFRLNVKICAELNPNNPFNKK